MIYHLQQEQPTILTREGVVVRADEFRTTSYWDQAGKGPPSKRNWVGFGTHFLTVWAHDSAR